MSSEINTNLGTRDTKWDDDLQLYFSMSLIIHEENTNPNHNRDVDLKITVK